MHGAHIYPQTNYTACAPSALVWHPDDLSGTVEETNTVITYNLNLRSAVKLQREIIRECIYLVVSEVGANTRCLPTLASSETVEDVYYYPFKDITVTYHLVDPSGYLEDRSQLHFITSSTIELDDNDIMFEEYDTNKWSVNIDADAADGELSAR